MAIKKIVFLFLITLLLQSCFKGEHADLILHNGNIVTMDQNNPVTEAIAIRDGKIIDIGKERQILNKYTADEIIDLNLATVYPGFIDAHCHFIGYGLSEQMVKLTGVTSEEDMVSRCLDYQKSSGKNWIVGRGWDNTKWTDQSFPTYDLINKTFPDNPVLLRRIGGHGALANQKALDLAGIDASTQINGGYIEVIDGKLTGFIMDNAVDSILAVIPKPTLDDKKEAVLIAQKKCFELGLTTVDDAGLNKEDVELLQKMEQDSLLKMKVYIMLSDNEENFKHYIDNGSGPIRTDLLNIGGVKFYGDGALGIRSACLLRPYADATDSSSYGFLLHHPDYFFEKAQKVHAAGLQMCTHCIGDSAARIVLDAYGKVLGGANDLRWRIEHAQVIDANDFEKFRAYSIIPSVQPTHATSDMDWAVKRLGKNRVRFGYAYADLLMQNGMIALGTDFPIERINPIETFYAAVARKKKDGTPKNGFQLENALTREEALRGMTFWAAMSNFEEKNKGSIEIGKDADLVVLSQDLLSVPEESILKTYVLYTFVNGECVYEN